MNKKVNWYKLDKEIEKKAEQAIPDAYENRDPMTNMMIGAFRDYYMQGYRQCRKDLLIELMNITDEQ